MRKKKVPGPVYGPGTFSPTGVTSIKKVKGFTLLETMIALMILSGGILLLVNSWGSTAKRIKKMEMNHLVASLLDQRMAEFESEFYGQPVESIPPDDNDTFGKEYPGYTWKMKSRELEFPDLTPLLQANGEPDPMLVTMIKALTEILKTTVKEVKFTVMVKSGKNNLEYSATRYFVDFNKEINIGL